MAIKTNCAEFDAARAEGPYPRFMNALAKQKLSCLIGIELIKHSHGRGSAAEVIPSQVVEAQSLEIDVVSGATFSSKVILKAIENALRGAN